MYRYLMSSSFWLIRVVCERKNHYSFQLISHKQPGPSIIVYVYTVCRWHALVYVCVWLCECLVTFEFLAFVFRYLLSFRLCRELECSHNLGQFRLSKWPSITFTDNALTAAHSPTTTQMKATLNERSRNNNRNEERERERQGGREKRLAEKWLQSK